MFNKILLSGVACAALLAGTSGIAAPARTAASAKAAAVAAKPELGAWGVDLSGMDKTINPGDSWYQYVNGTWDKNTEIPADKSSWGGFGVLAELSNTRTRTLIEDLAAKPAPQGSNEQKIGDLYRSFMDEAAIEKAGITPLQPYLAKLAAISSPRDLAAAFAEAHRTGVGGPLRIGVEQDLKNNALYAAYLGQGGHGLPDRDYYLEPKFEAVRTADVGPH